MREHTTTAVAHPNIAFIKYWGNRHQDLRIPSNGSISMNLGGLTTRTRVSFDPVMQADQLILGGEVTQGEALQRVSEILALVREMASIEYFAKVESENNFPMGTGIASSASAFAALSLAASTAAGLQLDEKDLSRLARRGSGSASRSIPTGFVEWLPGKHDEDSYAVSIAPPEHWNLVDLVAIVSQEHKATGSVAGHAIADTSPLQAARVQQIPDHLEICREAILTKDFEALAEICEHDSNMMHAVMMTSNPALLYWQPATIAIMQAVRRWRKSGIPVCYTIDAGPNVHVITLREYQEHTKTLIKEIPEIKQVISAHPGEAAMLIEQ